jgi:hypothetical protein
MQGACHYFSVSLAEALRSTDSFATLALEEGQQAMQSGQQSSQDSQQEEEATAAC